MTHILRSSRYLAAFPIKIVKMAEQTNTDLHGHDFKELVIITNGRGVHFCREKSNPVQSGDCFLVEGAHGYRDCSSLSLVNVLFKPARLPLPWQEAHKLPGYHAFFGLEPEFRKKHNFSSRLRLSPNALAVVNNLISSLEKELLERKAGFEFLAYSHFMELVGFLSREFDRGKSLSSPEIIGLSRIISHLEQNYMEPIKVGELTKLGSMSESSLLRAFRLSTGHSPIDYLIRLRIRHACNLLREKQLSITEIAFQTGFNDSNYFSRQFSRIMKESPRNFRLKTSQ